MTGKCNQDVNDPRFKHVWLGFHVCQWPSISSNAARKAHKSQVVEKTNNNALAERLLPLSFPVA